LIAGGGVGCMGIGLECHDGSYFMNCKKNNIQHPPCELLEGLSGEDAWECCTKVVEYKPVY